MSLTDYLLNGALVALVVLQLRGRRLTLRTILLPVGIVAVVAVSYLRGVPTAPGDLALVSLGALAGLLLGSGCGFATRILRLPGGATLAKAGPLAAVLWVAGVGARIAFELYATHGGGASIVRFSAAHGITSRNAWVDSLVLMALAEVLSRTAVLGAKYRRRAPRPAPGPAGVTLRATGPAGVAEASATR